MRTVPRVFGLAVGLLLGTPSWANSKTVFAAPAFETSNSNNSYMSYGEWYATGPAKLRVALEKTALRLDYVDVYTRGNVELNECTIRAHEMDGSGTLYAFNTSFTSAWTTHERTSNIDELRWLQVECVLEAGDHMTGVHYHAYTPVG